MKQRKSTRSKRYIYQEARAWLCAASSSWCLDVLPGKWKERRRAYKANADAIKVIYGLNLRKVIKFWNWEPGECFVSSSSSISAHKLCLWWTTTGHAFDHLNPTLFSSTSRPQELSWRSEKINHTSGLGKRRPEEPVLPFYPEESAEHNNTTVDSNHRSGGCPSKLVHIICLIDVYIPAAEAFRSASGLNVLLSGTGSINGLGWSFLRGISSLGVQADVSLLPFILQVIHSTWRQGCHLRHHSISYILIYGTHFSWQSLMRWAWYQRPGEGGEKEGPNLFGIWLPVVLRLNTNLSTSSFSPCFLSHFATSTSPHIRPVGAKEMRGTGVINSRPVVS